MARRTNILSTILGGFGGGAEGGLAQRERSLAEQERRRAADAAEQERQRVADAAMRAEARQGQLDIAGLADRGYVTPAQQTASMRKAAPGLQEALSVASGMLGQGPPRAFSDAGVKALESAAGQYGAPVADVTVGGQRMIRTETPMQEALREAEATSARAARAETEKDRRAAETKTAEFAQDVADVMEAYKWDRPKAADYVRRGGKSPFLPMTKAEQDASARGWATLEGQKERAASAGGATTKQEGSARSLQDALPSVISAAERLSKMTPSDVKRMSGFGVEATNVAQQQGGWTGLGIGLIGRGLQGSGVPVFTDAEQEYVEIAGAVADAVARASEVGVLTNFDINRFRNQVMFQTMNTEEGKMRKLGRLQQWAGWLANNKQAIEDGDFSAITRPPADAASFQLQPGSAGGDSPQARFDQRVQRGMDSTGAASLVNRETAASSVGTGAGGAPRQFTDADRADRWDEIKRQNPTLPDDQITAQVRREMP